MLHSLNDKIIPYNTGEIGIGKTIVPNVKCSKNVYGPKYFHQQFIDWKKTESSTPCFNLFTDSTDTGGHSLSESSQIAFRQEAQDFFKSILEQNCQSNITTQDIEESTYFDLRKSNLSIANESEGLKHETQVFPNPFGDQIKIEGTILFSQTITIQLRDLTGNTIWTSSEEIDKGAWSHNIPTDNLTEGIYILTIRGQEDQESFKLINNNTLVR